MKKALNDFPEWKTEQNKLVDLQTELLAVTAEKNEILTRSAEQRRSGNFLDRAVEELLAGRRPGMPQPDDNRLEELRFREKLLKRAIEVQEGVLKKLQSDLSAVVAEELRPQYQRLVKNVMKASLALRSALVEEMTFRDELQAGHVLLGSIKPMIPYNVSGLTYRLGYYVDEAKKEGYSI